MNAEATTIVSGIVLLLVFALVAWNLKRGREGGTEHRAGKRNIP